MSLALRLGNFGPSGFIPENRIDHMDSGIDAAPLTKAPAKPLIPPSGGVLLVECVCAWSMFCSMSCAPCDV